MVNLADFQLPQKFIYFSAKDSFLNFIDMAEKKHDASISMLLNRDNKLLVLRTYVYKNPFLK